MGMHAALTASSPPLTGLSRCARPCPGALPARRTLQPPAAPSHLEAKPLVPPLDGKLERKLRQRGERPVRTPRSLLPRGGRGDLWAAGAEDPAGPQRERGVHQQEALVLSHLSGLTSWNQTKERWERLGEKLTPNWNARSKRGNTDCLLLAALSGPRRPSLLPQGLKCLLTLL